MLDYLDSIEPGEHRRWPQGVKNFCLRNSGKGIVVLISDLMDKQGYETALRYLLARQMDVYVIQVLSAEELDPDVKGDLKLVDCEDQRRGRDHRQRPLAETLQADAGRLRRRCARVLHPPRHELPAGQQPGAGRATWSPATCAQRGLVR